MEEETTSGSALTRDQKADSIKGQSCRHSVRCNLNCLAATVGNRRRATHLGPRSPGPQMTQAFSMGDLKECRGGTMHTGRWGLSCSRKARYKSSALSITFEIKMLENVAVGTGDQIE